MPLISMVFGGLMIVLGLTGWVATGMQHGTALIPGGFGLILVLAGALVQSKPEWRKHAMHAAALVALLGLGGTARSLGKIPALLAGEAERPAAVAAQSVMAVLCLVFLALCVKSFIDARRTQKPASGG